MLFKERTGQGNSKNSKCSINWCYHWTKVLCVKHWTRALRQCKANIFAFHCLLQLFYTTTFPIIDVFVFCFVFCGSPGLHQRFKTDKICGSDLNKLKYTPMTNSLLVVSFFHFSFHSFFFSLGTPTFPNKMCQKKIWIKLIRYFYFKT